MQRISEIICGNMRNILNPLNAILPFVKRSHIGSVGWSLSDFVTFGGEKEPLLSLEAPLRETRWPLGRHKCHWSDTELLVLQIKVFAVEESIKCHSVAESEVCSWISGKKMTPIHAFSIQKSFATQNEAKVSSQCSCQACLYFVILYQLLFWTFCPYATQGLWKNNNKSTKYKIQFTQIQFLIQHGISSVDWKHASPVYCHTALYQNLKGKFMTNPLKKNIDRYLFVSHRETECLWLPSCPMQF